MISERTRAALEATMGVPVGLAMRYGEPSIEHGIDELLARAGDDRRAGRRAAVSAVRDGVDKTVEVAVDARCSTTAAFAYRFVAAVLRRSRLPRRAGSARCAATIPADTQYVLFSYHGIPQAAPAQGRSDARRTACVRADCCSTPSPAHATCYRHQVIATTRRRRAALGPARGHVRLRVSIAPRRRLARAVHRRTNSRSSRARHHAARRRLSVVRRGLPGDARRDRDARARDVPRSGRRVVHLRAVPQRRSALDRRARAQLRAAAHAHASGGRRRRSASRSSARASRALPIGAAPQRGARRRRLRTRVDAGREDSLASSSTASSSIGDRTAFFRAPPSCATLVREVGLANAELAQAASGRVEALHLLGRRNCTRCRRSRPARSRMSLLSARQAARARASSFVRARPDARDGRRERVRLLRAALRPRGGRADRRAGAARHHAAAMRRATSVAALFPRLLEMEREHGSVIRGDDARAPRKPGRLSSFGAGGMQHLTDAARRASSATACASDAPSSASSRGEAGWRIVYDGGELHADAVVDRDAGRRRGSHSSRPVDAGAGGRCCGRIPYAPMRVVGVAFRVARRARSARRIRLFGRARSRRPHFGRALHLDDLSRPGAAGHRVSPRLLGRRDRPRRGRARRRERARRSSWPILPRRSASRPSPSPTTKRSGRARFRSTRSITARGLHGSTSASRRTAGSRSRATPIAASG